MGMGLGQLGGLGRLGRPALNEGVGFSLADYMFGQADGLWFATTNTDRFFQENTGPTLADDVGEAIGLALDQRTWGGLSLSALIAAAPELESNGSFASDTVWTKGANWTISGGKATKTGGAANNLTDSALVAAIGRTYRVEFTIANYGGSGALTPTMGANGTARVANGTYVEYITAIGATAFALAGGTSFSGDVDNVSVKIVPGNHGLQATGTLKPTRQTAGAKFDGSDDNWLTTYLAQSGANFLGARTTVPSTLGATQVILGASGSGANRVFLGFDTSGRACGGVGSDSTTTIVGTSDLRNTEAEVFLTFDGTTVRLIVNGVVEYEAAQNGTPTTSTPFRIGGNNNNGTAGSFYGGAIAEAWVGREFITASRANQIAA